VDAVEVGSPAVVDRITAQSFAGGTNQGSVNIGSAYSMLLATFVVRGGADPSVTDFSVVPNAGTPITFTASSATRRPSTARAQSVEVWIATATPAINGSYTLHVSGTVDIVMELLGFGVGVSQQCPLGTITAWHGNGTSTQQTLTPTLPHGEVVALLTTPTLPVGGTPGR